jgi:hypothetical protein
VPGLTRRSHPETNSLLSILPRNGYANS